MTTIERTCPICGKKYTEAPALSRIDNETLICPDCGMRQALVVWKAATRKHFQPEPGNVYRNEGGGEYLCVKILSTGDPVMQNTASGWTFHAHGVGIYPDGTIDWNWSKNGYFA